MNVQETTENYLETILMLHQERGFVRSGDVANRMGYSKPTISEQMKKFRAQGYVEMDESGYITLTPAGDAIAQRIYEALPYVDEVDVQKQFPTTINLKITETQAAMVLQGTASAWLLDAQGKLLEPVSDGTDVSGLIQVTGVELLEPQQGQQAQTTPENQSRLDGLVGLTQALDRAGILASVTSIDVSSSTEIVMVYENRITARMLNNVDFDRKMQVLESIVATLGETDRGSINMRANDRAIWSPES